MKKLVINTDNNCLMVNPYDGFTFMSFIHSVVALGGFTDGVSIWIPLKEIKSIQYLEQEPTGIDLSNVSTMVRQ